MRDEKLIAMANQIAGFFRAYPAPEAEAGIRRHLTSFWTPVMLRAITVRAESADATLDPLVTAALVVPQHAQSPTSRAPAEAEESGELVSDAG